MKMSKKFPKLKCREMIVDDYQGRIRGARPSPKIGKNMILWRKIVIFHTKYPKNFRASVRNRKKYAGFL